MKIIADHVPFMNKEGFLEYSHIITIKPAGTFMQKVNTILKLAHYKIKGKSIEMSTSDQTGYISNEIVKTRSKKRYITFIPSFIQKYYKNDVIIYFKFKKAKHLRVDNNPNNPSNYYYWNWMYHTRGNQTKKPTKDILIKLAADLLLTRYSSMIQSFGLEYEYAPLHSLTFKFI